MEAEQPMFSFTPEANIRPTNVRTPPSTPIYLDGLLRRPGSPASTTSQQRHETSSPSKQDKLQPVPDGIKVEELTETDPGYHTDIDIVYPEELEEPDSDNDIAASSSSGNKSDNDITQHFSRLECEDEDMEAAFERKRRAKHSRPRTDSRTFKRSHSMSVKSDTSLSDSDAMGDHDRSSSARRLRRRTSGPNGVEVIYDDAFQGSPRPRTPNVVQEIRSAHHDMMRDQSGSEPPSSPDGMEVDPSDCS